MTNPLNIIAEQSRKAAESGNEALQARLRAEYDAMLRKQMSSSIEVESHRRTIGDLLQIIAKRYEDVGIEFDVNDFFKLLRQEYDIRSDGRKYHGKHI